MHVCDSNPFHASSLEFHFYSIAAEIPSHFIIIYAFAFAQIYTSHGANEILRFTQNEYITLCPTRIKVSYVFAGREKCLNPSMD